MIEWEKIEAGEYKSRDGRFKILKTWDRIYGNHWCLMDTSAGPVGMSGIRTGKYTEYSERTLLECKLKAEGIIFFETTH